jgi:CRISPR-associated endonuclease/helicase Cas3
MSIVTPIAHRRDSDKTSQNLVNHLLNVASHARIFAEKVGLKEHGDLLGLLHDLGKYSEQFQIYIQSAVGLINQDEDSYVDADSLKGTIDHSTAGAQLIWNELSAQGSLGVILGQVLALCIASHHSGLIDCLSSSISHPVADTFTKRINKSDDLTHLQEVVRKMDSAIGNQFSTIVAEASFIHDFKSLLKKIMIGDEVKGTDSSKNVIVQFKLGLLIRFLFSCLIDADRIDSADFEKPVKAKYRANGDYIGWAILIQRLEASLQEFPIKNPIDGIRKNISEHCRIGALRDKGIFTLTVPTGGGKTLASLRFALHHAHHHKLDRIIYVTPFTSIIDQNAKAVRKILEVNEAERGQIVLEHHSNLTPEQQGWKEKMLSENWDAPVVYTTSVQLLDTLFGGGTRGARRMHQLANSLLIFDEIQTLSINCVHLFCNAINFLVDECKSSVVLCTATQPLLNAVDPKKGALKLNEENHLIPDVKTLFKDLKRVDVINDRKSGGWVEDEIVTLALDEIEQSGSCLIIVNTKKSARALFQLFPRDERLHHFHLSTSMCAAHRNTALEKIRKLIDDGAPVLCVSTQLIEAGVDVDFGSVIRYTAGLDSIAQAAGRCNRNGRRPKGRVHVVNPAVENLDKLESIRHGRDITDRIFKDMDEGVETFTDHLSPEAINRYFEYYFFARRNEMSYPISVDVTGRDDDLLNLLSVNSLATQEYGDTHGQAPNIFFKQSFMSAGKAFKVIEAPTRGIIVPYGDKGKELIANLCAAFDVEKQFPLLREAQQYTVNVFPWELELLQKAKAVHNIQDGVDILYLSDARYYHPDFGLSGKPDGLMEVWIG